MKGLLKRLFGKKEIDWISPDDAKPIFEAFGIDIETIGFPDIKTKNLAPIEAYYVDFGDVEIITDERGKNILRGKYKTQARCGYQDGSGIWRPAYPITYQFTIKEGKLNLKDVTRR